MSTKKKKPARRPARRRTVYDLALDQAQARLGKASEERTDYLMKLDALNREIPRLERIIQALAEEPEFSARDLDVLRRHVPFTGFTEPGRSFAEPAAPSIPLTTTPPPAPADVAALPALPPEVDQGEFLARFMPRPGRTTTYVPPPVGPPPPDGSSEDPDEFLRG